MKQPAVDLSGAVAAVRAALAGGASPAAALGQIEDGPLGDVARAVRLGQPIGEVAAALRTGHVHADLLVRALAVVELTGAGGVAAVDQAWRAAASESAVAQLVRIRTAQARGTARMLAALPLLVFAVFATVRPELLAYYATPVGWATGAMALALMGGGFAWTRRVVARAAGAAAAADPLTPASPRPDLRRAAALGVPAFVVAAAGGGVGVGVAVGGLLALLGGRARAVDAPAKAAGADGGAAEAVELVAIALRAGLAPVAALAAVAPLAPAAARSLLATAGRRLRAGWSAAEVLAGSGLAPLGAVLAASERWGAPVHEALERLAADLRDQRRAAAEEAAERTQLALVFPTTLLTLPAFVLAVVPPMVWAAFAGFGGAA